MHARAGRVALTHRGGQHGQPKQQLPGVHTDARSAETGDRAGMTAVPAALATPSVIGAVMTDRIASETTRNASCGSAPSARSRTTSLKAGPPHPRRLPGRARGGPAGFRATMQVRRSAQRPEHERPGHRSRGPTTGHRAWPPPRSGPTRPGPAPEIPPGQRIRRARTAGQSGGQDAVGSHLLAGQRDSTPGNVLSRLPRSSTARCRSSTAPRCRCPGRPRWVRGLSAARMPGRTAWR